MNGWYQSASVIFQFRWRVKSNCALCTACYFLMTWLTIEFNDKYVFKGETWRRKKKKKNAVKKKKKTHTITNLLHQFITGFFFLIKGESGHFQLESHLPALMSPFETNWVPKPGSMFIKLQAHLRAWKTKQTQKNNFTFCDARKIENVFTCAVVSCAC